MEIKVRINKKMAEDWADRFTPDEGMPITPGVQIFTIEKAQSMISFLKDEIWNYNDYGMYDYVAAAKRQLANFQKAISAN